MVVKKTRGVYAVLHVPTGSAYIGSSEHVTNRYTWHRVMLRRGDHTSKALQKLWNKTSESEWAFVLICFTRAREIVLRENAVMKTWPGTVLNDRKPNYRHSEELRRKMSLGRARYLETHGARKSLSIRAKKHHAPGRFGR